MTETQQTNNARPARSKRGNRLKLLTIALTLALVTALTSVSLFAHTSGESVPFPLCPDGDPSTYTATCMGENLSTVYVYMPHLVVDKIYRYRFDITNKHKKNLDFNNQCEGLGFHGQHTKGEGHHGWTTFRAQSTTEVRTAQVKNGCPNRTRIMYWNIEVAERPRRVRNPPDQEQAPRHRHQPRGKRASLGLGPSIRGLRRRRRYHIGGELLLPRRHTRGRRHH